MAVAQWVRRWCKLKVQERVEIHTKSFFSAIIFISILLSLMDFSDIVILCNGPNSCYQQNLKCFDMPLLSLGLFHEGVAIMTVMHQSIPSANIPPGQTPGEIF